ncbi:capsular polysaccharide biosynthesis protein [Amylibacter marinus]|uniref:Capsular polysaccharide biosynthesis protein n=1 Tax=Amylibacter marinus TaxID=1475483 RepID=A0ABQ5VTM0_9RHOB|nr:capsular polysaccharide biosynthesis protein [Amylibacter marinus]GLQ34674.1 capsular polysaccharide biosynthesis protein [Amylibacter marinus]
MALVKAKKKIESSGLYVYSLGLLFSRRPRQILQAHGYKIRFGWPRAKGDMIAVWGRKKSSRRGRLIAKRRKLPLLTVEDSFLRSVRTGRQGAPSLGVIQDRNGIFFDANTKNDLHQFIHHSIGLSAQELGQARGAMQMMQRQNLSKYNAFALDDPLLPSKFVLVIDQTKGDASISKGGADAETFAHMLQVARDENPGSKILIKTHPETMAGTRAGHFNTEDQDDNVQLYDRAVSPWALFDRAQAVYCVTSQMGAEAIFAGHKPVVFGRAFYAGWGLSDDRHPKSVVKGWREPEHIFWATYLKYALYFDPFFNRASDFQRTTEILVAQGQNWRDGASGAVMYGMRLWKHGFMRKYLSGARKPVLFAKTVADAITMAQRQPAPIYRWGQKGGSDLVVRAQKAGVDLINVEDGFIRSSGLGAHLITPCSLVFDHSGIYYDPNYPSDLETQINASISLSETQLSRATALKRSYIKAGISKYNLGAAEVKIAPKKGQRIILVVGQVEDDASVLLGADQVKTNKALLWAARQKFPNEYIIYKHHPDVVAGLRRGEVGQETLRATADLVLSEGDISDLIGRCDTLCTITSLAGFEALMQERHVVCFGVPFYAGWGLTEDLAAMPDRRKSRPNLTQLIHATLIDYPRYWDPVSGQPCPPEVVLERFSTGQASPRRGPLNRALAKLQARFSGFAYLWR